MWCIYYERVTEKEDSLRDRLLYLVFTFLWPPMLVYVSLEWCWIRVKNLFNKQDLEEPL